MCASRRGVMVGLLLALAAAAPAPAAAQTEAALSVGGLVNAPRSFTLAELKALPWTTRDAALETASGPAHATWLGAALWTLLDHVGGVAFSPAEFARHKVMVTARDGRAVTLSRAGQPFDPVRGLRLVVPGDPRNRDLAGVVEIA